MLTILSPAKKLASVCTVPPGISVSTPDLIDKAHYLASVMSKKSPVEISKLMSISDTLGQLNYARYQSWQAAGGKELQPAVLMFQGDVYQGLDASSLDVDQLGYVQNHVRILSGLYGLLRPLDAIYPYRLEMGTRLRTEAGSNLYDFWSDTVTHRLSAQLQQDKEPVLVNLASKEYASAVRFGDIPARVVTPVFKDYKNGVYKIISFFAKRARGMMVRYMSLHSVTQVERLKDFDLGGYAYNASMSSLDSWVFVRR